MTTHSTRRLAGPALLVAALLVGLLAALVPAAPASASDDGGFAARMLELLNQQRSAASLPALSWSPGLAGVAEDSPYNGCGFTVSGRAKDMGVRNYFSHTILGCGTQTVFNVLSAVGIQSSASGENIAWVSAMTDPKLAAERLMNDLMADPGHRANILSPNYNTVGIGSWHTAAGQTWSGGGGALGNVFIGTQVFGHTTATATAPQPAGVPTNVKATGGNGAASVTWSPAAGPAPDVYGVFAWNSAGYTAKYATACATCTSATVTGLTNGGTYYFTVYGYNAAGWGNPGTSNWVTVAAPPAAPTSVRIVPGDGSMTGTWRGPTNPGTAIDGYALFVFDANGYTNQFAWVCPTCTTGTATGLVNGHSYYAVVYAHDPNGWGTPTVSDWIVAGTPGPPPTVSATRGNGAAQLSWAPAPNSGAAIDMYGLFAFDANGYTGVYATACATCTSGTLAGLINGKPYTVAVYAHNARGWGAPTLSGTVTPAAA